MLFGGSVDSAEVDEEFDNKFTGSRDVYGGWKRVVEEEMLSFLSNRIFSIYTQKYTNKYFAINARRTSGVVGGW